MLDRSVVLRPDSSPRRVSLRSLPHRILASPPFLPSPLRSDGLLAARGWAESSEACRQYISSFTTHRLRRAIVLLTPPTRKHVTDANRSNSTSKEKIKQSQNRSPHNQTSNPRQTGPWRTPNFPTLPSPPAACPVDKYEAHPSDRTGEACKLIRAPLPQPDPPAPARALPVGMPLIFYLNSPPTAAATNTSTKTFMNIVTSNAARQD